MLKYIEFPIWVITVNEQILLIYCKVKCIKLFKKFFENHNIMNSKWMFFLFKVLKKLLN